MSVLIKLTDKYRTFDSDKSLLLRDVGDGAEICITD